MQRLPLLLTSAVVSSLAFVAMGSAAQAPHPGPMQSGAHVPSTPTEQSAVKQEPASAGGAAAGFDVNQIFAGTCGWCHLKGGREAGKGPKLAGTALTDQEIIARIKNGKPGQMPAFGTTFTDQQLAAIIAYIRELEP